MILSPSPTKLRPFAPFVPTHNRQKSLSPPPDLSSGVNSTPLAASSGMFLLIRNVLPPSKTGFGKPINLVKDALTDVLTSDDGNHLADVYVTLVIGGRPQDTHSSSVYLELSQLTKSLDPLPRPDLLHDWKNALTKVRPNWEVVWAPQKKGKDRRLTVRFRVADSKEKVPANAADKIRAHLESKGHRTTGGYISFNGLVDITLADSHSVDTILNSSYYLIPSMSKDGIHVSPPKYISINHPFELCIGGINEYEGLHEIIEKWLYHRYRHDDDLRTTRILDSRISLDRDYFIFAMVSWESTLIVSGAGLVNEAITDMKRDLSDFRKEQHENNNLVQCQVAAIHVTMESQTNAVALIGNQLQQFGLFLLASRDEKAIEGKIALIDNSLHFESQCLRSTDDPAESITIEQNILNLKADRRNQLALLSEAADTTMRLIGPTPAALIPPLLLLPPLLKPLQTCLRPRSQLQPRICNPLLPVSLSSAFRT